MCVIYACADMFSVTAFLDPCLRRGDRGLHRGDRGLRGALPNPRPATGIRTPTMNVGARVLHAAAPQSVPSARRPTASPQLCVGGYLVLQTRVGGHWRFGKRRRGGQVRRRNNRLRRRQRYACCCMNIQHNAYFNRLGNRSQELCLNFYKKFYLFAI